MYIISNLFPFSLFKATGCRFDKKPAFRYSGCHAYELSALNVVLGRMFNFDESKYIVDERHKFFAKVSDFEENSLLRKELNPGLLCVQPECYPLHYLNLLVS